jgi:lysophospholipase L1-like esterase
MFEMARGAPRRPSIVAGTILPFNTASDEQNRRMTAVNEWLRQTAARAAGLHYCDTRSAVASPGDPHRLATSPDDLHPSPEGYRMMALALEPVVNRALDARR